MLALDIKEHPAYTCNLYALKIGVFAMAGAAACTLTYAPPYNLLVTACLVLLGIYLFVSQRYVMPRIKTLRALDWLVLSYCLPICFVQWISLVCFPDSEVSTGAACMVVLSALLFHSTPLMAIYVFGTVASWLAIKSAVSGPVSANAAVQLLMVAPVASLLARITVFKALATLHEARVREQKTVKELRETLGKLQAEIGLREVTEVRLQRAQKNEGLGMMAAGVAHDFNNTLAAINAFAEVIGLSAKEAVVQSHATEIVKAVKQASAICKQMLTYAGKSPTQMAQLDLVELIQNLQPLMQASCGKRITVRVRVEVPAAPVLGNAAQLQQVLVNLVNNGVEAIAGNGTIDVTIRQVSAPQDLASDSPYSIVVPEQQGNLFALTVTDSGTGMGPETIRQMFDPYFTTKGVGHGFGLSNVLGIARSHQASISVDSEQGKGTSVTLYFSPADTTRPCPGDTGGSAVSQLASDGARGSLPSMRILLVDDDSLVRDSMAEVLAFQGWEVVKAASGEAAMEVVRSIREFAALIIDFNMPGMNGCETLRALREVGCDAPAVLCSGHISAPVQSSVLEQFQAFLPKPFHRLELEEALRRLTRGVKAG